MNLKGAIFDFDGTLFDSMSIWDTVGEDYLRSLGYVPEAGLPETLRTMSLRQSAAYMQEAYNLPLAVPEIMEGINKTVEDYYFYITQPKPGVPEFLKKLKDQGVKMCVATATDRYQIEAALKRCHLEGYFSKIFTCTDVGYGKDEPHIFEVALAYLGTPKEDTLIFEDAYHAIQTTKRAGFHVVAVYDSHEPHQAEIRELADHYIEHF